jgi:hypothetical protein
MRHLGAEPAESHFSESTNQQPVGVRALELLELAGIEIEEAQAERSVAGRGMHHELATGAVRDFGAHNPCLDLDGFSTRCPVERSEPGFILVPHRQMENKIKTGA